MKEILCFVSKRPLWSVNPVEPECLPPPPRTFLIPQKSAPRRVKNVKKFHCFQVPRIHILNLVEKDDQDYSFLKNYYKLHFVSSRKIIREGKEVSTEQNHILMFRAFIYYEHI